MKKISLFLLIASIAFQSRAQDEKESFFKKENLFTGGTVNASFGNSITALGMSPYFGYSFNKYVDLAISTGIYYQSQRDYSAPLYGDKLRYTSYGPGAFVRIFPFKFLFGQAQFEYNFLRLKYLPTGYQSGGYTRFKSDVRSLLVGAGISSGKDFSYQKSYYYFSVLWDVADGFGKSVQTFSNSNATFSSDPHSPYRDNLNRAVPIFRAGYNIALFQGHRK